MKGKRSAAEHFRGKAISRELKKWKAGEIKDLSWLRDFAERGDFWSIWEGISARINDDLKSKGLWHRDDDSVVIPQENGIPSLKKRKSHRAEEDEQADESIYDPEALDEFYLAEKFNEEEIEDSADEDGAESLHPYLPGMATPSTHLLMRRYPLDLRESMARDLFDSHAYLSGKNRNLLPALCFLEVGISDKETFRDVWKEIRTGIPRHLSDKKFSFPRYQKDKLLLAHRLKAEKERYFMRNPWLKREKCVESIWQRFEKALASLTRKQWNAVKQVSVKRRPQSAVARDMRITLDSLRDRLEGAELKFRKALPELAVFEPSTSHRKNAKTNYIFDGLFDKREKIAPLYRVTKTGEKIEISPRVGKRAYRKNVNPALIKAWAHDTTPVPDFSFTEFFTRLYPKGHLERQNAGDNASHDRTLGQHSFASKLQRHKAQRSNRDLHDEEPSEE